MEESSPVAQSLEQLNLFRRKINLGISCIRILRGGILALCMCLLWALLSPEAWGQQLIIFLCSFLVFLVLDWQRALRPSSMGDWLLALEMSNPNLKQSAFEVSSQTKLNADWQNHITRELAAHRQEAWQLIRMKASSMLLPILLLLVLTQTAGQAWDNALHSLQRAAMSLNYGARLRVLEGSVDHDGVVYKLSRKTQDLTVLDQNLIELVVTAPPDALPMLQLRDEKGKILQTFRLVKTPGPEGNEALGRFAVTFALTEGAQLLLSTLSDKTATAVIHVKTLPVPKVNLSSIADPDNAWPDDKPLPLDIEVSAEHPLQSVQLLIKSGEQVHKELVSDILAQDKMNFQTNYKLALESYLEQDLQELEIIAEAVDRALPKPLIGRSKPLILKVASAYGRYRQTLQTLQEAKQELDRAMQGQEAYNAKHLLELGAKANKQADDSPFFDGLDRHQIRQFQQAFESIAKNPNMELTGQTSEELNRFLFEHESLDDRERDRDFFIAARTLSRLLEQKTEERAVSVEKVMTRISGFLDERQKRWERRVQRMDAQHYPSGWDTVKNKPFQQAIRQIQQLDQSKPSKTDDVLQKLSKTVENYRQWIEELETKEDSFRSEQEKQRQQGLANAQNQLKELQKRQGQVSSKLDKSSDRQAKDLEESWASVRMDQNSNIKGSQEMEGQLRSLSPAAAERMKAATDAMEATVGSGNQQQFVEAESASDMAGRLLQQAESAARQSQKDGGKRGRRRRVTSDQYYGNQVAG
ncbi:MAG: hypothetical protein NTX25_17160, partial [Proteobacteria bacterium]|nr:hypothetical protein [Pseudomonadota bacterium]